MALGKTRRRSQGFVPPKLQITSMMDMLTIILIFLLFSFSDTPENLTLDKDLELPTSTAKLNYSDNIKLVLSQKSLQIGDEVIAHLNGGKIVGLDPDRLKDSNHTVIRRGPASQIKGPNPPSYFSVTRIFPLKPSTTS